MRDPVLALLVAMCLALCSGPAVARDAPSESAARSVDSTTDRAAQIIRVEPGRVGPARVGMTIRQATRTGLFRAEVQTDCGRIPLVATGRFKNRVLPRVSGNRVVELLVLRRFTTPKKVGNGTTLRRLRTVYGSRLSPPVRAGYSQWTFYVRDSRSRYIGFLLGRAYTYDGPPQPDDRVTLVGLSRRERPNLTIDGC